MFINIFKGKDGAWSVCQTLTVINKKKTKKSYLSIFLVRYKSNRQKYKKCTDFTF